MPHSSAISFGKSDVLSVIIFFNKNEIEDEYIKIDNQMSKLKIGEILIKGNNVIKKYWKNIESDKNIIDGWLRTGDLGYFDSDGFLFLKSRKDDLINVAGDKFVPEEVELVIKEIPEISEAAVIGISNELFGQLPIAFVEKNNEITSSLILNYCIQKVQNWSN